MRFTPTLLSLVLFFSAISSNIDAAEESKKICSLLTVDDIASVGVRINARKLIPDEAVSLKKGALPGLTMDIRLEQCTSEMAANFEAFPVRWSVATFKDPIDKAGWEKMARAMGDDDKKDASPAEKPIKIGDATCEVFTLSGKKGSKQIFASNCGMLQGKQAITLEFAHPDRSKLPVPNTIKQLIDKMVKRL